MEIYCQHCNRMHSLDQQQVQRVIDHSQQQSIAGLCIEALAWSTVGAIFKSWDYDHKAIQRTQG